MVKRTRRAGPGKTGLSTELGGVLVGLGAHRLLGLKRLDGGAKDPWRAALALRLLGEDRLAPLQRRIGRCTFHAKRARQPRQRLVRGADLRVGGGVPARQAQQVGSRSHGSASWW